MSMEAARAFITSVQQDEKLQKQIASASDLDSVVTIGAEAGFEFTSEEFQAASQSNWSQNPAELNEEDLEGVAGGNTNWTSSNAPGGDCYTYSCDGTTTTTKGNKNK
jgi:predicted ribosomally synthesized peptide with nif11-like leader